MGNLAALYNTEITVAPVSSYDDQGGATLGTQETVRCRRNDDVDSNRGGDGSVTHVVDRYTTQDREFQSDDRFWLEEDNTGDDASARIPSAVGQSQTLGETVYYAEFG